MAVAGKVAITLSTENGGAWSADVTYDRLVAVKHNNNLYISRKAVTNVEPPNDEFWFLALEGYRGEDVQTLIDSMNEIISGVTQVGNAKTLDGHGASYFATDSDLIVERERINNLAKLNEGSTTGDAELVDIRVGANGETYANAGDAVRGQFTDLKGDLSEIITEEVKINEIPLSTIEKIDNKYWTHDGNFIDISTVDVYVIPVKHREKYFITSAYASSAALYVFLDSNRNFVSGYPLADPSDPITVNDYEVIIPDNVSYMALNYTARWLGTDLVVKKEEIEKYVDAEKIIGYRSNYLYGKKLVVCGDSITDAINPDGGYFKNYGEIVAERNGMIFVKDGISGSTMANINEDSFSNTRYLNHADFDYLTIWFGWNDGAYSELGTIDDTVDTTFYGAYKRVLNHYVTTYPTKKIGVVVPYMSNADYQNAVREVAVMYGVPYLDLADYSKCSLIWGTANSAQVARRNALTYDTTHPNQTGYEFISTMFEYFLRSL